MKNILILLKLSFKFFQKYILEYFKALLKPFIFGILGVLLLLTVHIDTRFLIVSLLSIPCLCYAFWKGYVITYGLIGCADNFIKNKSLPFSVFVSEAKKQEASFAKYVIFTAIISILLCIPAVIYIMKAIPFSPEIFFDEETLSSYEKAVNKPFLINILLLAPFLNYCLCAFYYKKEKENYFQLFLNCYKKINIFGLLFALIVTYISVQWASVYLIIALFLNIPIYSINAFWYSTRMKN